MHALDVEEVVDEEADEEADVEVVVTELDCEEDGAAAIITDGVIEVGLAVRD